MVRQCYVCKVLDYKEEGRHLSFHSFPADPVQKNIWASLLGFEAGHQFPKKAEICSNHFQQSDIEYGFSGKRYLKKGAVPLAKHSLFGTSGNVSSESPASESSVVSVTQPFKQIKTTHTETVQPIHHESISAVKRLKFDDLSYIPGPSTSILAVPTGPPLSATDHTFESSSATSTASEIEHEVDDVESTERPQKIELEGDSGTTSKKRLAVPTGVCTEQTFSSSSTITASEIEQQPEVDDVENTIAPTGSTGLVARPKKRKRQYVGDLSSSDFSSPEKAKKNSTWMKNTIASLRKKSHNLQASNAYLRKRIKTLGSLIRLLKEKSYINNSSGTILEASLSSSGQKILERMLKGKSTEKYGPEIRSFALTLNFYSPKAYMFVRKPFMDCLPHPSTLSKWYQSIDGSPGFTSEALDALRIKKAASKNQEILCNLVLDEMSIREQVEWTGKKFSGYIDIGQKFDSDVLPHAKEVLVFMLVCVNGSWKVPVGYFFLDGLTGIEKAELVKKCLIFIHEAGVTVTSLTFDGAPVNFTMASCLGASFQRLRNKAEEKKASKMFKT